MVLHLVADPQVLAARLAARGREAGAEIAERLTGATQPLPEGVGPVVELDTAAPVERLARLALRRLYPARA
jgi:ribose 1,5-bisphosphokinase